VEMIDLVREKVIGKLFDFGIEPKDEYIDEIVRFVKFSSVPISMLDRAIEEYIRQRWYTYEPHR
jgi:hypothetical protein